MKSDPSWAALCTQSNCSTVTDNVSFQSVDIANKNNNNERANLNPQNIEARNRVENEQKHISKDFRCFSSRYAAEEKQLTTYYERQ